MAVYYKMRQILLQNATEVYYKCDSYYKMRIFYYKMRQLLQNAMFIMRQYSAISHGSGACR